MVGKGGDKYMNKNIVIAVVIVILLAGGGFFVVNQQSQNAAMEQEKMIEKEKVKDGVMMKEKDTKQSKAAIEEQKDGMMRTYTGTVIAGTSAPYIEFNKVDYEKTKAEGKIIFLEFYANWCPICRAQAPKLVEGFNALTDDSVVGFRVNYNDDQTDEDEKKLAKDFGVSYQHTHVIVKDGKVISKSTDDLDTESFMALIQNAIK